MGKNKKKSVQDSTSATTSATSTSTTTSTITTSEVVRNPTPANDRLTKAVFKQNADGTPVVPAKVFYSKRMDEKGVEARQRLKKVLEQKVAPPPVSSSSESRLPIPDPKHVKPNDVKPNDVKPDDVKPNDGKPTEVKPNEVKPNDGKPNDVKPIEVKPNEVKPVDVKSNEVKPNDVKPSAGSSTGPLKSGIEKFAKTSPNSPDSAVGGQSTNNVSSDEKAVVPQADPIERIKVQIYPPGSKTLLDQAQATKLTEAELANYTFLPDEREAKHWKDNPNSIEEKLMDVCFDAEKRNHNQKSGEDRILHEAFVKINMSVSCPREAAKLIAEADSEPLIKSLTSMSPGCVGEIAIIQQDKIIHEKVFGNTGAIPKVVEKPRDERTDTEKYVEDIVKKIIGNSIVGERFVEETVKRIIDRNAGIEYLAKANVPFTSYFKPPEEKITPNLDDLKFEEIPMPEDDPDNDDPIFEEQGDIDNIISFGKSITRKNPSQKKRKLQQNEAPQPPNQDQISRLPESRIEKKTPETPEERYLQKTYCENDDKVVVYEFQSQNKNVAETPPTPVIKLEKVPEQVPATSSQSDPINQPPPNHQQQVPEAQKARRMFNKRSHEKSLPPPSQPKMSFADVAESQSSQSSSARPLGDFSAAFAHVRKVQHLRAEQQASAESSESESESKPIYPSWYQFTDDELQQVIDKAESMKSYNRDKKKPEEEAEETRRRLKENFGLNLAQVDPMTEAFMMAAALETELLRKELDQERMRRRCDLNFIENCRATMRKNKDYIEQLKLLLLSCSQESWQYREFDLAEREWFLTLMKTMNCSACNLILFDPVVINCGHVFCSSCIDPEKNIYGEELPLACPECSSMISLRAPAKKLEQLLDKLSEIFDDYKLTINLTSKLESSNAETSENE